MEESYKSVSFREFQEVVHTEESFIAAVTEFAEFVKEFCDRHKVGVLFGIAAPNGQGKLFHSVIMDAPPYQVVALFQKMEESVGKAMSVIATNEQNRN